MTEDTPGLAAEAEEAYAEFLAAQEDGGGTFEEFCRQRPELADDLRRIRAALDWADDLFEPEDLDVGAPPPPEFRSGEDRYEVLGEVARGGMGIVLRVFDRNLRRTLAMKVLQPDRANARRAAARFFEEAQVAAQLGHPSILPVHDVGVMNGRVFYTMPLVRGRDLSEVFREAREGSGDGSLTRALGFLLRACEAIGAAHARGVVHRDLKPENVMVGAHGEVYVMDWGLARIYDPDAESDQLDAYSILQTDRHDILEASPDSSVGTIDGQVLGTPSYMSPEQARGEGSMAGPASDVYSVGAMLYTLLTGTRPYDVSGKRSSTREVLTRLLEGPPLPIHTRDAQVPAELAAICERAMARSMSERYADMNELAADLRAFLERRVVSAYRTGAFAELGKWVQRNRGLASALLAAAVVLVAALIVSLSLKAHADEQARRADGHFRSALAAVDRMLLGVGDEDLSDVPAAQVVRRQLMEEALELYRGFLTEEGDDIEVRRRVVTAQARIAEITSRLADVEASIESQARAVEGLRAMRAEDSGDDEVDRELAFALLEQGKGFFQTREFARGRAVVEEALRIVEPRLDALEHDALLASKYAQMLDTMGGLTLEDDPAASDEWFQRSIAVYEATLEREGLDDFDRRALRQKLAQVINNLTVALLRNERPAEARPYLERALALAQEELDDAPANRLRRTELARALNGLAVLHGQLDPGSEAAESYALRMIDAYRELYTDFPNIPEYADWVAGGFMNLAVILSRRGRVERALEMSEEGMRWARRALEAGPNVPEFQRGLSEQYQNLFMILNVDGRHAEIAERIPEAFGISDAPLPHGRVAATAWAYCATNVVNDESLRRRERAALRDEYLGRMAEAFHLLADRGYLDPGYLDEEWFDGVRDHPVVVQLAEELRQRSGSGL